MTASLESPSLELDRIWAIALELSAQLSHNRQITEELQRKAEEVRLQSIHSHTGFTLRRFNLDVSDEHFDSELERFNVSLVQENLALQTENRQLSVLLKDYEGTLEAVMAKFRAHAVRLRAFPLSRLTMRQQSSQQHHLDLIRHYEDILLSLPSAPSLWLAAAPGAAAPPSDAPVLEPSIDPLHLSLSLSHLASLIRKALRSLQGEDPEDGRSPLLVPSSSSSSCSSIDEDEEPSLSSLSSQLSALAMSSSSLSSSSASSSSSSPPSSPPLHPATPRKPNAHTRDPSEGGYIGLTASTSPHHLPTTSTSSLVDTPPRAMSGPAGVVEGGEAGLAKEEISSLNLRDRASRGRGSETSSRGGGRGRRVRDEAMESEIELEALRRENEELRRLLGISELGLESGMGTQTE